MLRWMGGGHAVFDDSAETPFCILYAAYWINRHYHNNMLSSSFRKVCFIASSSLSLGLLQSEYIFSLGYYQTGPLPLFP